MRHYADDTLSRQDSKWCEKRQGILYPRASAIGGCTIHNAMITLSGPADDWNAIASLVDDQSWNSERMRDYFERLENCHYIRPGYVSPICPRLRLRPAGEAPQESWQARLQRLAGYDMGESAAHPAPIGSWSATSSPRCGPRANRR